MESRRQREPFLGDRKVTTRGSGSVGNIPIGFAFAQLASNVGTIKENNSIETSVCANVVVLTSIRPLLFIIIDDKRVFVKVS
jgi:hypothetical protein